MHRRHGNSSRAAFPASAPPTLPAFPTAGRRSSSPATSRSIRKLGLKIDGLAEHFRPCPLPTRFHCAGAESGVFAESRARHGVASQFHLSSDAGRPRYGLARRGYDGIRSLDATHLPRRCGKEEYSGSSGRDCPDPIHSSPPEADQRLRDHKPNGPVRFPRPPDS